MCGNAGYVHKRGEYTIFGNRILHDMGNHEQNRGKETAGVAIQTEQGIWLYKDVGTVSQALPMNLMDEHLGRSGTLQVRYSTSGKKVKKALRDGLAKDIEILNSLRKTAHPFMTAPLSTGPMALGHNGNTTNSRTMRRMLAKENVRFETDVDTEVILMTIRFFIDREGLSLLEAIKKTMQVTTGTFACLLLVDGVIYAFRDQHGNRPLKIAETDDFFLVASENNAWHRVNEVRFVDEVHRGEIVEIRPEGLVKHRAFTCLGCHQKCCVEKNYHMYPCTTLHGEANREAGYDTVADFRKMDGISMHSEHPQGPGIIIPMMESGLYIAQGYFFAHAIANPGLSFWGIPLPKDPWEGRAFQESDHEDRIQALRKKYYDLLTTIRHEIAYLLGKKLKVRLICVDDTLVRSDTATFIIALINESMKQMFPDDYQNIEVVWLLGSPPMKNPCFYGMDTPTKKELVASNHTIEEIRTMIGASYLGYLSLEAYRSLHGPKADDFCMACFDGQYKIPIIDEELIALRDEVVM